MLRNGPTRHCVKSRRHSAQSMFLSVHTRLRSVRSPWISGYYWMSLVTILPLAQGILVTVHFLLSVCGEQVCEGTEAGEVVSGLWTCRRGPRNRDWDPFLKPHVLFFFMQVLHWLHSPSSHSEARWPWGGGEKRCYKDSASVCFGLKQIERLSFTFYFHKVCWL